MERSTRRIAWTSAVMHGLVHASVLLLPTVLYDLKRDLGASLLELLAVANAMYLLFGVAAIPAGYLADRLGSRAMLLLSAGGCTAALLLVAFAPSFAVLTVGLVLLGLSAGAYHPSGLSLLSRKVGHDERGRAIGIHGVGGSVGEAIAPAWAALFAAGFGWRVGFATAAALAAICAAVALTLPAVAPCRHAHERSPRRLSGLALRASLRAVWASRPLRWLLVGTAASGFVYRGVLTFLPLHLADRSGSRVSGSLVTSLVLLAGIVAQRVGGELADRLPRERLLLAEVALFAPVLVLLGVTSGAGLVASALCFGFLWTLAQPLAAALAAAHADARDHGLVYGIQLAATFGVGSFATTVGGVLHARGGTSLAFLGFSVVAVGQLGAAWALVRSVRGAPSKPAGFSGAVASALTPTE